MGYRDESEGLRARVEALESELAEAREQAEAQRLQHKMQLAQVKVLHAQPPPAVPQTSPAARTTMVLMVVTVMGALSSGGVAAYLSLRGVRSSTSTSPTPLPADPDLQAQVMQWKARVHVAREAPVAVGDRCMVTVSTSLVDGEPDPRHLELLAVKCDGKVLYDKALAHYLEEPHTTAQVGISLATTVPKATVRYGDLYVELDVDVPTEP